MVNHVYFNKATEAIREFFTAEFKTMGTSDVDKVIKSFYKLTNYEEEGLKVRPSILITSNINAVAKNVQNCIKIPFYNDETTFNFNERLKALMCFCAEGWVLYINFGSDDVEYGLIKCANSLKEKTLQSQIFEQEVVETISSKTKLVLINILSSGLVLLKGIKGNETQISFSLIDNDLQNWETSIKRFVEDVLAKLKTTPRKLQDIKTLYTNILINVFHKLHGTLCLVVDKDFKDSKGVFSDGTWLPEPIDFGKLFLQSKSFNESKLRAYADIFVTMLNYDGMTIVDNRGRIRAYNVFVETNKKLNQNILGGARLRAAYSVLNTNNKKIRGLYFQSHEGDVFYKTTRDVRKEVLTNDVIELHNYKQLEMGLNSENK